MNLVTKIYLAVGLLFSGMLFSNLGWAAGVTIEMSTNLEIGQVNYTNADSDTQHQIQLPADSGPVANFAWGIDIDQIGASSGDQLLFNPEVTYEFGQRIEYSSEIKSITDFWQECVGTVGNQGASQDQCNVDVNVHTMSDWHLLGETLTAQGAQVEVISSESSKVSGTPSNPIKNKDQIKGSFKFDEENPIAKSDFYQLGYRQAVQYSWEGSISDSLNLSNIKLFVDGAHHRPGLSMDSTVILRLIAYPAGDELVECPYSPIRVMFNSDIEIPCESHQSIAYEIRHLDYKSDEEITAEFDREENLIYRIEDGYQDTNFSDISYYVDETYKNQPLKIILHYEVQYLLTNTNLLTEFNPMDYMGRPSLDSNTPFQASSSVQASGLDKKTSSGSMLFLLALFFVAQPLRRPGAMS